MIRAVLDTNLFISMAIRPGGVPDRIRQAWQVGDFTLLASHDLLSEIHRVLAYPRLRALIRLSGKEEAELLRLLVEETEMTPGTLQVDAIPADPADTWSWPVRWRATRTTLCPATPISFPCANTPASP